MIHSWFNVRKAAQVVAFFARSEGGSINVVKLVKLLYLSDRENLNRYEFPILNDELVSMKHGPVTSATLDCINGAAPESDAWDEFVTDRANHMVGLAQAFEDAAFDELSEAELETLYAVWDRFGSMTKWQIRDWTHENLPEWEDPNGSSYRIPYSRVLKFLGKPKADQIEARIEAEHEIYQVFAHA